MRLYSWSLSWLYNSGNDALAPKLCLNPGPLSPGVIVPVSVIGLTLNCI